MQTFSHLGSHCARLIESVRLIALGLYDRSVLYSRSLASAMRRFRLTEKGPVIYYKNRQIPLKTFLLTKKNFIFAVL